MVSLTDSEYKTILALRSEGVERMEIAEKQRNCPHRYTFECSGHKSSWYKCIVCGHSKED